MHESFANDRTHPDEDRPAPATTNPSPNRTVDRTAAALLGPYRGPHAMATSAGNVVTNAHSKRTRV